MASCEPKAHLSPWMSGYAKDLVRRNDKASYDSTVLYVYVVKHLLYDKANPKSMVQSLPVMISVSPDIVGRESEGVYDSLTL